MGIRTFFHFYGGKWRIAPHYPPPKHDTIIEPFAGSAGYSLRYPDRKIHLVERDPVIAATWRYLINVSEEEILSLPDVEPGGRVSELTGLPQEAKYLIGWWIQSGRESPRDRASSHIIDRPNSTWGANVRHRIADQLSAIRHWTVIEGDYSKAPDTLATWFIDPPYQDKGRAYKHGSRDIDFEHLAGWCRSRPGQVMVCENVGAKWLPFKFFRSAKANNSNAGRAFTKEAIWTKDCDVGFCDEQGP